MLVITRRTQKINISCSFKHALQCSVGLRMGYLVLIAASTLLSACSDTPSGNIALNQAGGMVLHPPEFLNGRSIVRANLVAQVSVVADGVSYDAVQTNSISSPWIGQVYVPEGSTPTISVTWVETQVPGLRATDNGELPLAIYTATTDTVIENTALEITTEQYITQSTDENPQPQLDLDADGASNVEERQAGSRPADASDIPASVLILYSDQSPVIDGAYESLWNTSQFRDLDVAPLSIDKLVRDENGIVDTSIASDFKWAAMHDGSYLYLMVFAESGANQTPTVDSEMVYNDDSVDVYWDGDNSKGASYDGVDDFHIIVGLLAESGSANDYRSEDRQLQIGDNSSPIDPAGVQYAVCLCSGDQQIYEIRLDLTALKIPVDTTFGLEVNINNDANGGDRDAKWAWFNDTGEDDTWRFPVLMGNARLEAPPNR